jgi:hypothetical protein
MNPNDETAMICWGSQAQPNLRATKESKKMEWIHVRSSAIRKVAYDASTNRMYIDFENSDPNYEFCGVPESVFRGMVSAPSVGHYYNDYVKDRFDCF